MVYPWGMTATLLDLLSSSSLSLISVVALV